MFSFDTWLAGRLSYSAWRLDSATLLRCSDGYKAGLDSDRKSHQAPHIADSHMELLELFN